MGNYLCYTFSWSTSTNKDISKINLHLLNDAIQNPKLDLEEARENTRIIENNMQYEHIYKNLVYYNAGNSWVNEKISDNKLDQLNQTDKDILSSIRKALEIIKPISYKVNLFHGFEYIVNYNDSSWKINESIKFNFPLSKTPSHEIASTFASDYGYINHKILGRHFQKFLFVKYPNNTKHICLDVRMPYNDEYEYLSIDETLELQSITYMLDMFIIFPYRLRKYYIFQY